MSAVKVRQAYRFALDPSPAQERALRSHAGAARFAWNWGLARCTERYGAERKWYSAAELHKLWNAQKKADPAPGLVGREFQVRLPGGIPGPAPGAAGVREIGEGRAEGPPARVPEGQKARQGPGRRPVWRRGSGPRGPHRGLSPAPRPRPRRGHP